MRKFLLFLAAFYLASPQVCVACAWDYDTIAMERQEMPGANEMIAGYFIRHSNQYYQWRITNRMEKGSAQQTPLDLDDIAVAYDKLGQQDKAIETIQEKTRRWPGKRIYESEANLGTFYIHSGKFKEGLKHINRAIEINPEAHFGREIIQKLLVEYLIKYRKTDWQFSEGTNGPGFWRFVSSENEIDLTQRRVSNREATKGILGMMRFGNYDSPILLEALGNLLEMEGEGQLAARAYLKASYEVRVSKGRNAYVSKANYAVKYQTETNYSDVERDLRKEIEAGDSFLQQIVDDEKAWIAAGKNLDVEFAKKYYKAPMFAGRLSKRTMYVWGGFFLVAIVTVFVFRSRRSKKMDA